jgi:hypothetical protein
MAAYESESVPIRFRLKKTRRLPGSIGSTARDRRSCKLLNKAANVAEQNSKHAIDMAQQLSHQLRAAQQGISELEAEVVAYQNQSERAEQWLHKVYTEIEDRFLQQERSRRSRRRLLTMTARSSRSGVTSLAAPNAASSRVVRYSLVARLAVSARHHGPATRSTGRARSSTPRPWTVSSAKLRSSGSLLSPVE